MLSSSSTTISSEMKIETNLYNELISSLPGDERDVVMKELDSAEIVSRAELLCSQLASDKFVGANLEESRTLFLAALRNVKLGKITAAQLASMHILDSAIRTLYTNPFVTLVHKFVENNKLHRTQYNFSVKNLKDMPTSFRQYKYNTLGKPNCIDVSDLPHRMQKPLLQRFFNFSDSEWNNFCKEVDKAPPSEQIFNVLIAPEEGCYSSIIAIVQRVLKCMHTLDFYVDLNDGFIVENIMPVPSFTMFQAAINAKAHTLNRTPVELIPTYGYIEANHYAALKAAGKIALAIYMPEVDASLRYKSDVGRFRSTIDGHLGETAFAGAIHDVYHAMREMAMSENVAKARMRLAAIAKNHPNNKRTPTARAVDDILIDGELIYSYPPSLDTTFNPEHRSQKAQTLGDLFYMPDVRIVLHDNLKRAFIEDIAINETLWQTQFNIGRADLRKQDQDVFDEIKLLQQAKTDNVISFSDARVISQMGLLANSSLMTSDASPKNTLPKPPAL